MHASWGAGLPGLNASLHGKHVSTSTYSVSMCFGDCRVLPCIPPPAPSLSPCGVLWVCRNAWDGAVARPLEAAAEAASSDGTTGGVVLAEWGRQQLLQLLNRVMIRSCKSDLALLPPCYKKVRVVGAADDTTLVNWLCVTWLGPVSWPHPAVFFRKFWHRERSVCPSLHCCMLLHCAGDPAGLCPCSCQELQRPGGGHPQEPAAGRLV